MQPSAPPHNDFVKVRGIFQDNEFTGLDEMLQASDSDLRSRQKWVPLKRFALLLAQQAVQKAGVDGTVADDPVIEVVVGAPAVQDKQFFQFVAVGVIPAQAVLFMA